MTRKNGLEFITGIVALVLSIASLVLFCLSYTTGYYIFGQMQSGIIAVLLAGALAAEAAALMVRQKFPAALWPKFFTFAVTALLAAAAMLLIGDRVEGIGNCIITDYDSGHGGEEAIYLSLAASGLMLIAMIYNLIGSFGRDKAAGEAPAKGRAVARDVGFGVSALAVLLAVIIPTANMVSGPGGATPAGPSGAGAGGTYTVSFNQGNGNAETVPGYQFLCSDLGGMVKADSRMYIDVSLTLDGGNYTLFVDSYVVESGKRAEIGDDTGLGMVLTMNAEGAYTENADGTVTTSIPTHAVFEMRTDTYSAQMKQAAGMAVNGSSEDGTYDSADEPAVLDFVPETIWTLGDGTIETYRDANAGGTYTVSFNQGNGNAEDMPEYQFLCSDFSGMVKADSRFYVDVTLTLDGGGNYTLFADSYVIESGKRAEIGDDTGLGLVLTMNAEGAYTENADGTYTTAVPTHAVFEMQTDTYSAQMKSAAGMAVNGNDADGVYDSASEPAVLDFVPETVWTLGENGGIISWLDPNADSEEPPEEPVDGLTVTSDDGATAFTFNADGTYKFSFEAYGVEDAGTYTYEGGVLTVTDANGAVTTVEGDPLKLHYVTSISDQLTGDFTIPAADLSALLSGGGKTSSGDILTVTSDDGATTFTFNTDGTYKFAFEAYGVEDAGTYTYEGGVLTITDANGAETTVEGTPLTLHYVTSISDQLTGDFIIPAAELAALLSGGDTPAGDGLTITSDDGATTFTFNTDGTYKFAFDAYGVEDTGTYTYGGGTLTITNANGSEMTAQGDPLKFHYVTSISDQLTGDFTVPASDIPQ